MLCAVCTRERKVTKRDDYHTTYPMHIMDDEYDYLWTYSSIVLTVRSGEYIKKKRQKIGDNPKSIFDIQSRM